MEQRLLSNAYSCVKHPHLKHLHNKHFLSNTQRGVCYTEKALMRAAANFQI